MIRKALIAAVGVLVVAAGTLRADANTWTGGRPVETAEGAPAIVAAHPDSPDVVYGAFGPALYRSNDGGRTWRHLRSFYSVQAAVLVHPASPSTIYVAAEDVFKSTDGGETWSAMLLGYVNSLAGSPTDASTVYAGSWNRIHKTTNAGATWSTDGYTGIIASLIIDPRHPTISYAAAEGFQYWGDYPGSLGKTVNGGVSWQKASPEAVDSVIAVAVDPGASSTVYIATGHYLWGEGHGTTPDVLRSDDSGVTWTSAGLGLPPGGALSLAVDPHVSGVLYAGTEAGVYRSRDGGLSWTPFSQQLAGMPITSLAIDGTGHRLHAGTSEGVYDLEIARGPVDVAAGPAGESRVLVWDEDRLSLGALDASGHWTTSSPGGASATWTAIAIATTGGERTHVLWQNGDGRAALEVVGASGREAVTVLEKRPGWIASDLAARDDGTTDILWSSTDGRMSIANVSSTGVTTGGLVYGPAPGWSAVAIADGSGDDTWALWRSTDGRSALSVHREGTMVASYKYAAEPEWSVEDLAVATDGRPRLLRTSPGGLASIATIDAEGRLTADQRYSVPGFAPRRIAAGADGQTRLLCLNSDGQGELLRLNSDNTLRDQHSVPSE